MDAVFKICIFGDGGVGKTTLVRKYVTGVFKDDTTMTIGVDFHVKKLEVERKNVALQIWDFAGEERFRFLLPTYVRGANGAIFMYDITRYSTLKSLSNWVEVFNGTFTYIQHRIPILMTGGKLDLEENRSVSIEAAKNVAVDHKFVGQIECSAKTGQNVEDIFVEITRAMLKNSVLLD